MTDMSITCIEQAEAIEQLTTWARCRDCTGGIRGVRDRVVTDYLREHIYLLSMADSTNGVARPVYIQRFRSSVRRQLEMLSEWFEDEDAQVEAPEDDDACGGLIRRIDERCLRILETFGEIVHCGGGYYLPTPLRSIKLVNGESILIGGLSTQAIYRQWNYRVEWAGFARHTSRDGKPPADIPRQSLSRWIGISDTPLAQWTTELLAFARSTLQGVGSAADSIPFDVYNSKLTGLQARKWIASNLWSRRNISPNDLWLCRSQVRPRSYWIAPLALSSEGLRYSKVADIHPQQVRRLMYGLDLKDGCPTRVEVRFAEDRRTRLITLHNWPTRELQIILTALGYQREHRTADGRRWPLPMHFAVADLWWPEVSSALSTLGIDVAVEQNRR